MALADLLEEVLLRQGPMSGAALATSVRRRKEVVLDVLEKDLRFFRSGSTKANRYMVIPHRPSARAPIGQPSLDTAYDLVRKSLAHVDGALPMLTGDARATAERAIRALYAAEDALSEARRQATLSKIEQQGWRRHPRRRDG